MQNPMCLVENTKDGKLVLQENAVRIISQIKKPMVVVAIVGPYRTGKSYLMNRLMGRRNGFALGVSVKSKTKGIWAWYGRHPKKQDCYLLLLDTEGLGDIEKGNEDNDNWIFALSVLLSSTLVYNGQSSLHSDALGKLHYVSKLTEMIRWKSSQGEAEMDREEFINFFPNLVWVLRDFTLTMELDGEPITADQYLQHALKLKKGQSQKVMEYNFPRICIQDYFKEKKCYVLPRPVDNDQLLSKLEIVRDKDLKRDFVLEAQRFCDYIFTCATPKAIEGKQLNGSMICRLLETFVQTIQSGSIPCVENAIKTMTELENGKALQTAIAHYKDKMSKSLRLPASLDELSAKHIAYSAEAMKIFVTESISEDNKQHQIELETRIAEEYENKCEENIKASKTFCDDLLSRLSKSLDQKVAEGVFNKPGGAKDYCSEKEKVISSYKNTQGKGIMAEVTLKDRLIFWQSEQALITKVDTDLTEAERNDEDLKLACETAKQEKLAAQAKLEQETKMVKDLEEGFKTGEKMMNDKIKQEIQQFAEEKEKIIKQKEEEKMKAVEDGNKRVEEEKQKAILKLRAEIAEARQKNIATQKEEPLYAAIIEGATHIATRLVLAYFFR